MESDNGRPAVQVLGENEALQQFFSGQDVSGVLDSSVVVDTSILEQYLSSDSFMLPESPPDSSSEACSPAQIPDVQHEPPYWSNQQTTQEAFQSAAQNAASASYRFTDQGATSANPEPLLTHHRLLHLGLTNTSVKSRTPDAAPAVAPVPRPQQHARHPPELTHYPNPENCSQVYTSSACLPPSHSYISLCTGPGIVPQTTTSPSTCGLGSTSTLHTRSPENKKRRRSDTEEPSTGIDASCGDCNGTRGGGGGVLSGAGGSGVMESYRLLVWEPYRLGQWSTLHDSSYRTLSPPAYFVDTDKGFIYSIADEAFVCQKKNHFQVTVHIGVATEPQYVQTPSGPEKVDGFQIKVFGVKLEAPSHLVTIEQSQPDRSKKPFHPVRISLPGGKITRVTLGRLHFSETTANNMRKKGKPNPDQRYFQMVVGLYAAVKEETFLLSALVSERIIVRATNPGQFEMDGDTLWQRGAVPDAVVCSGRVGVNTDSPDEALVVCGNATVMGTIMQPSDLRAKQKVQEVDSEQQLKRITQMRIVEFDYKPEFASTMGIDHVHQTGVIAQEVKELLPSAVKDVGDVTCSDGERINHFLMVDKEQIFMENVGAVQQLSKLTDNLETRINELEVWNRRLAKLKSLTGSLRSSGQPSKRSSMSTTTSSPDTCKTEKAQRVAWSQKWSHCLQHKLFQASLFTILATMAVCAISITALYLVNLKDEGFEGFPDNSNSSMVPLQTSTSSVPVPPTSPPGYWPPDVDFCDLLYCNQVYCCPSKAADRAESNTSATGATEKPVLTEKLEKLDRRLKSSGDWRNTSIHSVVIKENQQVIDSKYCVRDECGPHRYVYRVPVSPFVPVNMRITLLMNSTELLVLHLCRYDESAACPGSLDKSTVTGSIYPSNTQGEHQWPLHIARLYHSSYHFRSTVAGQADCSTDHHFQGALFTDYIFHFYRRCTNS